MNDPIIIYKITTKYPRRRLIYLNQISSQKHSQHFPIGLIKYLIRQSDTS